MWDPRCEMGDMGCEACDMGYGIGDVGREVVVAGPAPRGRGRRSGAESRG